MVWSALEEIADPEIPTISVVELGVIGQLAFEARDEGGERLTVELLPTFVGCPAIDVMQQQIGERLRGLELADEVRVDVSFRVPWTSDRITPGGTREAAGQRVRATGPHRSILRRRGAAAHAAVGEVPVLRLAQHDSREPVRPDPVPRDLPLRRLPPAVRAVQGRLTQVRFAAWQWIRRGPVRADELLDAGATDRLDTMRHSAAHIMAAAVLELFPEAKLGIGPAIRDGFYYDFDLPARADARRTSRRSRSGCAPR